MSKLPIVAIVGRANVGKSSIFNRLLEKRQAIVADVAGTTRDSIYGKVSFGEHKFWIVDTAGLKSPDDEFELTIQDQIFQATDSADVLVVVVENGVGISDEDRRVTKMALKSKKPVILAINKSDNPKNNSVQDFMRLGVENKVFTSSIHGHGFDALVKEIVKHVPRRPAKEENSRLNISFVGRPNVGKSSLFNCLLQKQQAVVADVAGTTRDVNRQEVSWHKNTVQLLDTAGIRKPGKVGKGIEHFSVLRALQAIEESDVCCLVMDGNEINTKLDQKIAGMIKEAGKGLIVVISKWDSVEKDAFTRDAMAAQISREFPYIAWAPLVFTSSENGQNVTKIFEIANEIAEIRKQKIQTKELNKWLSDCVRHHPPAGLKNKHPNLNYIVQDGENPPSFRIYGRDVKYLHWSYKRYMEKEMRSVYGFGGTPVEFYFIANSGKGLNKDNKKVYEEQA